MISKIKINSIRLIVYLILITTVDLILSSCNSKVSITPPDSPPPDGYIYINTKPQGFQIYLDGKQRRRVTPDSLTWLTSGNHLVTLKKNLYRDTSFTINIVDGVKEQKFINYSDNYSMLGSISCDSKPEGAEIFINDSSTGSVTPATLSNILPGNYYVKFHIKNYQDDSVNVTISSGNKSSIQGFLVDTTIWSFYTTKNSQIKTDNLTCVGVGKNDVIWVGTSDQGVLSYNGSTWGGSQLYAALPSVQVNCISVTQDKVVFFGTSRGFVTYDGSSVKIYQLKTAVLPSFYINAICFDNTGNWYIATQEGLNKSSLYNGNRTWYTYPDSIVPSTQITCVLSDNSGNVWAGILNGGLSEITNNSWQRFTQRGVGLVNDNVRAVAQSNTGTIWVGFGTKQSFGGGLSYYDGVNWQNANITPPYSQTNEIFIDKNNTKWVATDQGLVKFSSVSDVTIYNKDNTNLNINDVTGVAQDSKGNIWISTYGGGLVEYKGNH